MILIEDHTLKFPLITDFWTRIQLQDKLLVDALIVVSHIILDSFMFHV